LAREQAASIIDNSKFLTDEDDQRQEAPTKERAASRRRIAVICIVGLIAAAAIFAYNYFWLLHPIGNGPAGPSVPREPFGLVWSKRPVVLVGMGDSMTEGFGSTSQHSYFERLAKNSDDEFPDMRRICLSAVLPNLDANNIAVSGSTSIEHIELLLPKLKQHPNEIFGVVVLTTGGNDIIHNYGRTPPREGAMYGATIEQAHPWIKNFEERLNAMLDQIEARFPGGCRIFVANIYDPTDGVGDIENAGLPAWPNGLKLVEAYNNVIAKCAANNDSVELVDIHTEFLGHGIHSLQFWREYYDADDPHYWYFDNLEDPNDRGYDAIRRLFLIKMAEVLPSVLSDEE